MADYKKTKKHGEEDALDPEEFVHFYKCLINRPELDEIIEEYSEGGAPVWGPKELCKFMKEIQKVHGFSNPSDQQIPYLGNGSGDDSLQPPNSVSSNIPGTPSELSSPTSD